MNFSTGQKIQFVVYLLIIIIVGFLTFRNYDAIKSFFYKGSTERIKVASYTPFDQGSLFVVDNRMPSTAKRNLSCPRDSEWYGALGATEAFVRLSASFGRGCQSDLDCGVIAFGQTQECPPQRTAVSISALNTLESEFSLSAIQYFNFCGGVEEPLRGVHVPLDCRFMGAEQQVEVGYACVQSRCEIVVQNAETKDLTVQNNL